MNWKKTYLNFSKCLLTLTLIMSNTANVHAVGFAEPPAIPNHQKTHLNIPFTGGDGTAASPSTCTSASTSLPGDSNPEKAFLYFVRQGFSEKQAAGIIGNFMVESGVNPKRVQGEGVIESETLPRSGGYGIAQWDDRKPLLKKFTDQVDTQKRPIFDLGLQLDFVMFELKGPAERGGSTEAAAYQAFQGTKDNITQATTVWMDRYERPGIDALNERIQAAQKTYGDFATGAGNPANTTEPTDTASCGGSGDIVAIAQEELAKGVLEKPLGCDAGNPSTPGDCGAEVNKYTDNMLEYWCADFVSWVYREAGMQFTGGASGGWRLASVESIEAYMRKNGTFTNNSPSAPDPQPGDVYVINNGEHIGIVVKVEGNKLYTISGNTSTENYSNGVGVGEAVYTNFKNSSSITGYGGLR